MVIWFEFRESSSNSLRKIVVCANPVRRNTHKQANICVKLLTGEGLGSWHMIRQLDNGICHYAKDCTSARAK